MKTKKLFGGRLFALAMLLSAVCIAPLAHALDVLDAIDVKHSKDFSTITIHTNVPVNFKSHVPQRRGDVLRIRVDPVITVGAEDDVLFANQFLQWSPDAQVPLSEVTYESSGSSTATVILQFEDIVEFEPPTIANFQDIVIRIRHPETVAREKRLKAVSYTINLASSTTPFSESDVPFLEIMNSYRLYTSMFDKDGKEWTRLRLGFFKNKQEARSVLNQVKPYYPAAWIASVSQQEVRDSANSIYGDRLVAARPKPAPGDKAGEAAGRPPVAPQPIAGSATKQDTQTVGKLMKEASQLMTDSQYDRAISMYNRVLKFPENEASPNALEYLGLARERKGQLAHAKAVYTDYLKRYPEGEDAERVRQRLKGLTTARKSPRQKLAAGRKGAAARSDWDVFGGFSQFFRRDENTTEVNNANETTLVTQKALSSDLDVTTRLRTSEYDLRTRFTGGYTHDFLDNGTGNDTTLSSLYFDGRSTVNNMGLRFGRQSRSTGGVLGRFDGLLLDIPVTQKIGLVGVTGFPVNSSRDGFNGDKYFYGAALEFDDFAEGWDAGAFVIEQRVDSLIDRRAVGGELRYFDRNKSLFLLTDYDIFFNTLNTTQVLGNWTTRDKTTFNIVLDYRNSPILTTSNALQGAVDPTVMSPNPPVPLLTFDEMRQFFTEDEIYQFAQDRTARSKLATLGVTRPVTEKLQVSGDITLSKLSDTVASGSVAAVPGTDNEFFYNVQLIGSNLIKDGDISIIGLRFIDATTSNTTSLSLNTRYPVTPEFRINPRFSIDFRSNTTDNTEQFIYRPSARLTYSLKRRLRLEAELGGEWSDRELVTGESHTESYFINLGYRADF